MLFDVSDRFLKVAGVAAISSVAGYCILIYFRRYKISQFERELVRHELGKLRIEVDLLRVEVLRVEALAVKARSPMKSRERSVTFEGDQTELLSHINRVKSTQSLSSDGEYADASEEWDNDTVTIPCLNDPSRPSITIPKILRFPDLTNKILTRFSQLQ